MDPEVKLERKVSSSLEELSTPTTKHSVNTQPAATSVAQRGLSYGSLPSREKFLEELESKDSLRERPSLLRRKKGKFKEPQVDLITGKPYVATVIDRLVTALADLLKGLERLLLRSSNNDNPLILNQNKKRPLKKRKKSYTLLNEQSAREEEEEKEEKEN
ncbi:MAG: hypothetical protein D6780_07185 [Candidatus Dadabacteria bacterium]|nr:MAG: hypothetical protein D6780_07185 [Candidatus Dadabacteria bacterium]